MAGDTSRRHQGLDVLRLACFAAVVAIHGYGAFPADDASRDIVRDLSRFAVPCFFILFGYFSSSTAPIAKLWRRVAVPLVVWLAIYNYKLMGLLADPVELMDRLPSVLWTGGAGYHLWYLTALLVGGTLVFVVLRCAGWKVAFPLAALLYAIGMAVGVYQSVVWGEWVPPEPLMRNGVFFAPIYILIGLAFKRYRPLTQREALWWLGLALVGAIVHVAEKYAAFGGRLVENEYSFGTLLWASGLVGALLCWRRPVSPVVAQLAQATFGAYLVHVIMLRGAQAYMGGIGPYGIIAFAISSSLCLALLYRWGFAVLRRWLAVFLQGTVQQKSPGKSGA